MDSQATALEAGPVALPRRGVEARVSGWLTAVPAYPLLFALSFVVSLFVESWAGPTALVRPLLVVVVGTGALQVGLTALARDRHKGAFFAAAVLLALFVPIGALALAGAAVVLLAYGSVRARRLTALPWPAFTRLLNVMAVVLIVIVSGSAAAAGAFAVSSPSGPTGRAAADAPDIYLLLLDAYPRSDTLAEDFGYDNGPFVAAMERLGFDLAPGSHSNYPMTALTLASMLNYAHIRDLVPDPPSSPAAQYRRIGEVLNDGAALRESRRLGYEVVSIPSQVSEVGLHSADRYLDSGEMTVFESTLLEQGLVPRLVPEAQAEWLASQDRSRIVATFHRLAALAEEPSPSPRLVLAHVMAPHPPIVFASDGAPIVGCSESCSIKDEGNGPGGGGIAAATAGQVNHVNDLVLETVGRIVEANARPAVIVVFSDHGYRLDPTDKEEVISNLFLARSPGKPGLFPDDTTLINVFPRILNAYAGTNLPLASEESYWTDLRTTGTVGIFNLERVR